MNETFSSLLSRMFFLPFKDTFWPLIERVYSKKVILFTVISFQTCMFYTLMASKSFYTSKSLLLCSVQIWIDMRVSNDDRVFIFRWTSPLNSSSNRISNLTQVAVTQKKAQFWFLQMHIILLKAYVADLEGASIFIEAILWVPASVALILQKACKSIKPDMSKFLCYLWERVFEGRSCTIFLLLHPRWKKGQAVTKKLKLLQYVCCFLEFVNVRCVVSWKSYRRFLYSSYLHLQNHLLSDLLAAVRQHA